MGTCIRFRHYFPMCTQGILPLGGLYERAAVPLSGAEHAPAGKPLPHSSLDEDLLMWLCDQIADSALAHPLNVGLFAPKSDV